MSKFRRRQGIKRALVLGCGPAGMFATHALVQNGFLVEIWSKRERSHMYGAQYLHQPIPGLPNVMRHCTYSLVGDVAGYARKVYGDACPPGAVSPATLATDDPVQIYDIRAAYHGAFDRYGNMVRQVQIDALWAVLGEAEGILDGFDIIVSTIPAQVLCLGGHQFHGTKVWAAGDAPDRGLLVPFPCEESTVVCSGLPEHSWYRKARVFGHTTVEWPYNKKPPIKHVAEVTKPLSTNCDCFGDKILKLGRYGKWQKGYLAHEAYFDTREAIR